MNTLLTEPSTSPSARGEHPTHPITAPARQPHAVGPQARILYVDGDASTRRLGELVLARSGYGADTAKDGEEAWTALQNQKYSLLITDNQMPRLTGLELIRKLRRHHMLVPVILASTSVHLLPADELPRLQCRVIMAKPFTPEQLLSAVYKVLRTSADTQTSSGPRWPVVESFRVHVVIDPHRHWGINE